MILLASFLGIIGAVMVPHGVTISPLAKYMKIESIFRTADAFASARSILMYLAYVIMVVLAWKKQSAKWFIVTLTLSVAGIILEQLLMGSVYSAPQGYHLVLSLEAMEKLIATCWLVAFFAFLYGIHLLENRKIGLLIFKGMCVIGIIGLLTQFVNLAPTVSGPLTTGISRIKSLSYVAIGLMFIVKPPLKSAADGTSISNAE